MDLLQRGVYLSPWLNTHGEQCVVAVTRQGRRSMEATIFRGVHAEPIVDMLWKILDAEDPPPPPLAAV